MRGGAGACSDGACFLPRTRLGMRYTDSRAFGQLEGALSNYHVLLSSSTHQDGEGSGDDSSGDDSDSDPDAATAAGADGAAAAGADGAAAGDGAPGADGAGKALKRKKKKGAEYLKEGFVAYDDDFIDDSEIDLYKGNKRAKAKHRGFFVSTVRGRRGVGRWGGGAGCKVQHAKLTLHLSHQRTDRL